LVPSLPSILVMASIAIDFHMGVIQVHVKRNLVDDVLLDEGSSANIIIEDLQKWLGLPSPKPVPYMFRMANQSLTKPIGIIRNLKIHIHGIPYIATFTVMQNNMLDGSYFMLLGRPWLKNVKVIHDWGKT